MFVSLVLEIRLVQRQIIIHQECHYPQNTIFLYFKNTDHKQTNKQKNKQTEDEVVPIMEQN